MTGITEALLIVCAFLPQQCQAANHVTITEGLTPTNMVAYYIPTDKRIVVNHNDNVAVEAGNLAHELTHAIQTPANLADCHKRETEAYTVQANLWSAYHGYDQKYTSPKGWVDLMVAVDCDQR